MKDLFGVPLAVGDRVVYTIGSQSYTYLDEGTIVQILKQDKVYGDEDEAVIKSESGRKLTNTRASCELMSIKPVAELHPELFI